MSDLASGAQALAGVMSQQSGLYQALLSLAGREEQAILDGDVGMLTAIVDEQEQTLDILRMLETERMTALAAIAAATGEQIDALTLTRVSAIVGDQEQSDVLTTLAVELRAQALALGRANERNTTLLTSSREIVDRWLQYLRGVVGSALTYTETGEASGSDGSRVVDRSA